MPLANLTIDKNNIRPAYLQLKDVLAQAIRSSALASGHQIPSENALSKTCGIHRHTARKSLQLLSEEGLITSIPGRGWFVAPPADKAPGTSTPSAAGSAKASAGKVVGLVGGAWLSAGRSFFAAPFLNSLLEASRNLGYNVKFFSHEDLLDMQSQGRCGEADVIIWMMPPPEIIPEIQQLAAAGLRIIVGNRQLYGTGLPFVVVNQYSGAREIVSRLLQAGHRRIGCVTSDRPYSYVSERWRGFKDALRAAGVEPDEDLVLHVMDATDIREGLVRLIEGHKDMTALFLAGSVFHRQTLDYLQETKREIPADISLVAFDEVQVTGFKGKIVAAAQPVDKMAQELLALAARLLSETETRESDTSIVIEPTICPGESIRGII